MNPNSEHKLIVIAGPTAIGKTALSIALAQHFDAPILSCDSRQIYREMKIGVARPSEEELASAPHHFIASHTIHAPLNAAEYAAEVHGLLRNLFETHPVVILTGGTGLFIRAVVEGFDPLPPPDPERREELEKMRAEEGIGALRELLLSLDPNTEVDVHNPQRMIRAIEILEQGHSVSSPYPKAEFKALQYYLDMDRTVLYERIDQRVDAMMEAGLEEEARALLPYRELNALKTVGYAELFTHFDGLWSLDVAVDKIKQHSRNYAKRQLTWFKNQGFELLPNEPLQAISHISNDLSI